MKATLFLSSVGARLTAYSIDTNANLRRLAEVDLPAWVMYAWPHPDASIVYVVTSDGGPTGQRSGATWAARLFDAARFAQRDGGDVESHHARETCGVAHLRHHDAPAAVAVRDLERRRPQRESGLICRIVDV